MVATNTALSELLGGHFLRMMMKATIPNGYQACVGAGLGCQYLQSGRLAGALVA